MVIGFSVTLSIILLLLGSYYLSRRACWPSIKNALVFRQVCKVSAHVCA